MNSKLCLLTGLLLTCFACSSDDETYINPNPIPDGIDLRQEMRSFVQDLSSYARQTDSNFIVIPQNGQELITKNGEANGIVDTDYLASINGIGREDLFYGYDDDNVATPLIEQNYMIDYLTICNIYDKKVLVTDYCWDTLKMSDSYVKNHSHAYISFAAPSREMELIPDYPAVPFHENSINITGLEYAKNFLYIINPEAYSTKSAFINALNATNYDIILMDCFFNDNETYTIAEINSLKVKNNGGTRLVIAYMSIGEAEDYRYYWQSGWNDTPPSWLERENPDWPGCYEVRYWDSAWQHIIMGNPDSYLDKIVNKGFDGVYLDIIDAFEYFEETY